MASKDIEQLVSGCINADQGCFAADPNALEVMAYMDDSLIRANLNAIAVAADTAAISGIPLEDQTYQTVITKEVGRFPSIESPNGGVIYEFATGDTVAVSEVMISDDHSDKLRSRTANCAYVCGKFGLEGTCTLKLSETDNDK